jgi:hypothetical protein
MLHFRHTAGFRASGGPHLPAQHAVPTDHPSWPRLRAVLDALVGSAGAHRQYVLLTSRGTSHDRAIKQALGISLGRKRARDRRRPAEHSH